MILVPVIFAFMGFAVDLGRLYLVRGELNQVASAMALAAAVELTGTQDALDRAGTAAARVLDDGAGHGARYDFGRLPVGETTGAFSSTVQTHRYFSSLAAAVSLESAEEADGTAARYVQVNVTADAPLVFWSFPPVVQGRSTPVAARAVAGLSAPLCTACGIEPFAVQALSTEDTTHFGFTPAAVYTFAYQCNANPPSSPAPQPLATEQQVIQYLLIDPTALESGGTYVDSGELEETQALYRIGAQGLLPSTVQAKACIRVGDVMTVWGTNGGLAAGPMTCNSPPPTPVQYMLCGLYARFGSDVPEACRNNIGDVDLLAGSYRPDTDLAETQDYAAYTGNTRRVITVPVVETLGSEMTVLGFRQFLLQPNPGLEATNPGDADGRFAALYLGTNPTDNLTTPVPLEQGQIGGCRNGYTAAAGPGKVVLHQ